MSTHAGQTSRTRSNGEPKAKAVTTSGKPAGRPKGSGNAVKRAEAAVTEARARADAAERALNEASRRAASAWRAAQPIYIGAGVPNYLRDASRAADKAKDAARDELIDAHRAARQAERALEQAQEAAQRASAKSSGSRGGAAARASRSAAPKTGEENRPSKAARASRSAAPKASRSPRQALTPVGRVPEHLLDPYAPPNPHALAMLYGRDQLAAALNRYSLTALKPSAERMQQQFPGSRPAKKTKAGLVDYLMAHAQDNLATAEAF